MKSIKLGCPLSDEYAEYSNCTCNVNTDKQDMTTKELFEARKKELKDWQYGTVYKLYDREEECDVLADDVDRYFDDNFIKEIEASIRKEVVGYIQAGLLKRMMNYDSKDGYSMIHDEVIQKVYEDVEDLSKGITLK